jgi:parvulin-like peptidyl-prolyl isomerase
MAKVKKPIAKSKVIKKRTPDILPSGISTSSVSHSKHPIRKKAVIVGGLIVLAAFLFFKKAWFVAAVVNGQPITRFSLNQILTKQYGAQTLETMINQTILEQEIARNKIIITDKVIDDKIAEITASLPANYTLDQALKLQGLDKAEFRNQLKIQLAIDKILVDKTNVTDKEVADYIASNSAQFKDSSPAATLSTARNVLQRQKSTEAFNSWFSALRQNTKILKFL